MASNRRDGYDAIIIGGGPAGATAAAVLAQQGRHVLVLEKEQGPRYQIGESLMPFCYFPLERIGVIEQMKTSRFPKKYSVQFVRQSGEISQPFYFFQHLKHEASTTWQVLRSEFDQMLLSNARAKGAEVREGMPVMEIVWDRDTVRGVRAREPDGHLREFHAPVTIDASGRNALAQLRSGWRQWDPALNKVSLWTYYKGAQRDPGLDEGATTVAYLPKKGWFWYIALPDDVVSVGIVANQDYLYMDTRDPAEIFAREVEKNAWIKQHLAPGKPCDRFRVTQEFSYRSKFCAANGLVLAGDAFAFLDPVFSSGVFLALKSGVLAADAVDEALKKGDVSASSFAAYGATFCQGLEAMRKLVYAFYDQEFSIRELITKHPALRGDLTDCLIGNLFRDFTPLFKAVGEFAKVPEPLPYGTPLTADAAGRAPARHHSA